MHVDWHWIKQRPHFIAELLPQKFDVTVCTAMTYRKSQLVKNTNETDIELRQLFILPLARFNLISKINSILIKFQLIRLIANVDIVWITHPKMFKLVINSLPESTKLVYDCMDDALEFPRVLSDDMHKTEIFELEKALINRCNIIFSSSNYLSNKLKHRYGRQKNIYTVNNAISLPEYNAIDDSTDILKLEALMDSITGKKLLYLGTISEWMDFELITDSVQRFPSITYIFVGPCDIPTPKHERIIIFGPIKYNNIFRAMNKADALIMPFQVNELIKAVNPVKVYDYIYSCKPAIVAGYAETAIFEDFIHLYNTPDEYMLKLELLVTDKLQLKKSNEESLSFINKNTWPARVDQMLTALDSWIT